MESKDEQLEEVSCKAMVAPSQIKPKLFFIPPARK